MIADRVAEFVAEKKKRKRPATYEWYQAVLETIFLPWCAANAISEPDQMTDKVMDRLADDLRKRARYGKPIAMATVRTYLRAVRVFLGWCGVPKGRFEMPAQPRRIVHTLTRQEIDLLERMADNERDKLIVRVLADTGVRISELLGLARGDLHANTYERKYLIQVIGKGDRQREVPIPKDTYLRLEKHAKAVGGGFIFRHHRVEKRLDKNYIGKMIRRLGHLAGFGERRIYCHLLRHSYATQQVKMMKHTGASLIDIQRTMGHTTLAMLTQVYSHTQPVDSYDQLMAGLK
jgi:integrase/recombinase XerD